MSKVNILDFTASDNGSQLELVRLDRNETAFIPFTTDGADVWVHYCQEAEISGYVRCNSGDCILCRVGKSRDQRLLIPIYLPASKSVGVLAVSPSLRPHALLPQLANILKAGNKPMVMFASREGNKFNISSFGLQDDIDAGEATIQKFKQDNEAGQIKLNSVYPQIENDALASVPEIAQLLELKGMAANADSTGD